MTTALKHNNIKHLELTLLPPPTSVAALGDSIWRIDRVTQRDLAIKLRARVCVHIF